MQLWRNDIIGNEKPNHGCARWGEQNKRSWERKVQLIDQDTRICGIVEITKNYDKGRFGESDIVLKVKISENSWIGKSNKEQYYVIS